MTSALNKNFRILRAIEECVDDTEKTEDFVVKAAFLSFSEVLAPMSDKDDVLVSDDNVIPMRDSIESVRALVAWLTRDPEFEITRENMRELVHLSDKYMIESLRKDIRVHLKTGIFAQESPTLELWELAARYSFDEMEQYCRKDANVLRQIDSILSDPSLGVAYLLSRHLPVPFVSQIVCDLLTRRTQDVAWLRHCLAPSTASPMPYGQDNTNAFSNTLRTQLFAPQFEPNFTEIGQHSEHTKAYQIEVNKGRFSYANPAIVCPICSQQPTPVLLPPRRR